MLDGNFDWFSIKLLWNRALPLYTSELYTSVFRQREFSKKNKKRNNNKNTNLPSAIWDERWRVTCRVKCCVPFTCRTGGQTCKIWYASVRKKKTKRRSSSLHPAETDVFSVVASLQPKSSLLMSYSLLVFSQKKSEKRDKSISITCMFRACLHRGGGPQIGEVTRLGGIKK